MRNRLLQILLLISLMWLSWLLMMLVHETGHVIGAEATGGTVERVIWHPLVISRTDVHPNPHRMIEVWSGPLLGSAIPLVIAALFSLARIR